MWVCEYVCVCACVYACYSVSVSARTCVCHSVCVYKCVCECVCVCVYACMYVSVFILAKKCLLWTLINLLKTKTLSASLNTKMFPVIIFSPHSWRDINYKLVNNCHNVGVSKGFRLISSDGRIGPVLWLHVFQCFNKSSRPTQEVSKPAFIGRRRESLSLKR